MARSRRPEGEGRGVIFVVMSLRNKECFVIRCFIPLRTETGS